MKHFDQDFLSRLMDGEWQDLDVRRSIVDVCRDEALRAKWARYHLARDAMRREALDASDSLAGRISAALADEPTYSNVTAIGTSSDAAPGPQTALESSPERAPSLPGTASLATTGRVAAEAVAPLERIAPVRDTRTRTLIAGFGLAAGVALVTVIGLDAWRGEAGGAASEGAARVALTDAAGDGSETLVASEATGSDDAFSRQLAGAPLPEVEFVANTTGAYWVAPDRAARRVDSEERLNMLLSQHIENSPTAERQGMLPYSRLVGYDERAPER